MYIYLCITFFPCIAHYLCTTHFPCTSLICLLSYIKALYCNVWYTSTYRELFVILIWYQSHCSKCFVQSLSFLAFFRCLNHLRYCSAATIRILVCPLPSKVEYIAKRLTAFIGIFGTSLRSEHLHHHLKDFTFLDSDAQKSPPSVARRVAKRLLKNRHAVTRLACSLTCVALS